MNNLKTTDTGRMPIVLDDLRFVNDSIKEALKGIVGHHATNPIVLSGCEYDKELLSDTDTLIMTAGSVYIAGEVYSVAAVNMSLSGSQVFYWNINSTFDSAGSKTFQSGTVYDTYEVRVAEVLKASSVPSGGTDFSLTETIFQYYREGIKAKTIGVPVSSFQNNFTNDLNSPFKCSVGLSGEVFLSGQLKNTVGLSSPNMAIGTLKAEFRPTETMFLSAVVIDTNGTPVARSLVKIESNGAMTYISEVTSSWINANLAFSHSYLQ